MNPYLNKYPTASGHIRHQVVQLALEQDHMTICESSRWFPQQANNSLDDTRTHPQHQAIHK